MGITKEKQDVGKIAMLVALSCVLQISESLIPHPLPGLRLGLANIMTLIALVNLGFAQAMEVAVLRTILSSFLMGTFMSAAFILSFSAACISTLIMGLLYWLSSFHRRWRLSIVGISILSALAHNTVQLYLAYLILIRHKGIFVFLPWLCIGSVIMGWLTGTVVGRACLKFKEMRETNVPVKNSQTQAKIWEFKHYCPGNSYFHRLRADLKISVVFISALTVLIFNNLWFYLALFLFLAIVTLVSKTPLSFLVLKIKKSAPFVLISFLLPLCFNSGTHVLSQLAYFKITAEGLTQGAVFALRVLFLFLASSLLVRTTSPKELAFGLTRILVPLRFFGVSQKRVADILSLSLLAIPVLWEKARNALRAQDFKKITNLRNLIPFLSDLIVSLYSQVEQMNPVLEPEQIANTGKI